MMEFKDVQTLKDYLNKEHQGSRIKFATKVFHVLNFTKEHPDSINCCGAAWCNNGMHFICNATIMANFLNLRSNSINTNFRDHGFRIDHSNLNQIKHEFPHLINIRNWKMRSNNMFPFKLGLSIEEIEKIPCTSARSSFADAEKNIAYSMANVPSSGNISMANSANSSQSNSAPTSFSMPVSTFRVNSTMIPLNCQPSKNPKSFNSDLPDYLLYILQDSQLVTIQTTILCSQINYPDKPKLIQKITTDWLEHFGQKPQTLLQTFINNIRNNIGDENDLPQITTNALFLIHKYSFESNYDGNTYITFNEFMNFVLHYGFVDSWVETLIQLSVKMQNTQIDYSNSSSDEVEPSSDLNSIRPNFHSWFQPWFNKESALRVLYGDEFVNHGAWFVSPSDSPMVFNLFYKNNDDVSVTDIIFDPDSIEKRFSVSFNGTMASAPNWGTLLYAILKLDSNQRLQSSTISKHLSILDANKLISRFTQKKETEKKNENVALKQSPVSQPFLPPFLPVPLSRRIPVK